MDDIKDGIIINIEKLGLRDSAVKHGNKISNKKLGIREVSIKDGIIVNIAKLGLRDSAIKHGNKVSNEKLGIREVSIKDGIIVSNEKLGIRNRGIKQGFATEKIIIEKIVVDRTVETPRSTPLEYNWTK